MMEVWKEQSCIFSFFDENEMQLHSSWKFFCSLNNVLSLVENCLLTFNWYQKTVFLNSNNRHIILVSSAISLTISEFKVPEIAHYGKRVILKVKTFFIISFWNLNWFNQNRQQSTLNLIALFPSSGSNSENSLSLFF